LSTQNTPSYSGTVFFAPSTGLIAINPVFIVILLRSTQKENPLKIVDFQRIFFGLTDPLVTPEKPRLIVVTK
jgi:hypothetical protein